MAYSQSSGGRNTNAIMANVVDRGPWQFWDTVQAAAGSTLLSVYNLFSVPIGGQNPWVPGTQKSKLQTNMTLQNQFSPPKCLLLMQIGFYFGAAPTPTVGGVPGPYTPMFLDDISAILNTSYMEFKIDDKIFHEGQLWQYPAGVGLAGATSQTGQASWTNGLPAPCFTRGYGDWAKYIAPLQLFSLNIYFPGTLPVMDANGPGWYMPTFLDGLTDRSVQ